MYFKLHGITFEETLPFVKTFLQIGKFALLILNLHALLNDCHVCG